MGEVWVGWKSDDMEANIRTFPPSPPTHDIAVGLRGSYALIG